MAKESQGFISPHPGKPVVEDVQPPLVALLEHSEEEDRDGVRGLVPGPRLREGHAAGLHVADSALEALLDESDRALKPLRDGVAEGDVAKVVLRNAVADLKLWKVLDG